MSAIVYQEKNAGLTVGLSWSVISSQADTSKDLRAKIRKQAGMMGATRHIINALPSAKHLGLYTPPMLGGIKPPKRLFSLAMAFLQAIGGERSLVNAILLMSTSSSDRRALVVITAGQVVYDRLEKNVDALERIKETQNSFGIQYAVFSDTRDLPDCDAVTWTQLLSNQGKACELFAIPANTALLLGTAAIALLAIGYGTYHYTVLLPAKERAEKLARQAAADQTPQYLQKLSEELRRFGWDRSNLTAALAQLGAEKAYVKGWELKSVNCEADAQICKYAYDRLGGEVKELIALHSDKTLISDESSASKSVLSKSIKPVLKSLIREDLPDFEPSNVELRTRIQRLLNAKATVTTGQPEAFPSTGLDMSKVNKAKLVKRTSIEITSGYPFTNAVLAEVPDFVGIRSFTLNTAIGGDKAVLLSLILKGHSYAK